MTVARPSYAAEGTCRTMVYLLRHGAVQSVEDGKRYIGWQDPALSDVGLRQAHRWADYFADLALEEIFCSDLTRCLETARIIGTRCSVEPRARPELREVCLGSWEGQRFDTVKTNFPRDFQQRGDHIADHRPPEGESFRDLLHRAWPVFSAAAGRVGVRLLIVTHAGVIRVLLCRLLGMPLENLFSIGQACGALNIIDVRPGGYRLEALNLQSVH
jgi:alpha-ribazole phosphatase